MNSDIRWMGLDHKAIFEMINAGPGPNASDAPADFWGTLSAGLNDISSTLHKKLGDLNVHWEGVSAEQALAGMNPLKDWAAKAENGSTVMKTSFEMQGNYVGDARNEVPPPKKVTTPEPSGWQMVGAGAAALLGNGGPAAAVAAQAADHEAQERASDEAARKAVQAMQKYEKSSDWNADTLGRFEDPPKLVVDTPPPAPGLHGGSVESSGMHGSTGVHHNQQTQTSSVHHSPIGGQHAQQPNVTPGQQVPHHNSNFAPNQFTSQQGYTSPQNHPGLQPTPPKPPIQPPNNAQQWGGGQFVPGTGPFGGGHGPNSGGRPGIPGGGSGGRGGLGPNAGFGQNSSMMDEARQGRPGAGTNPMAQEGAPRTGPPGSNTGAGGRGGQSGMAPGGRRAEDEEENEHEAPDYLLETDDIWGDERTVAPSVIGEKPEQQ
ncbi:hypothetical protein ALI144C_44340 [Actinosynnema sp. ALI-1.44]|uniref:PPE domain-containing protein n=1 Tax=Actinosynnema sp. ALI-1.44 TaxID=1933779 RepID=UPI00097C4DB0|nr:PPE domain-containing protein [Actinosynnema sp. ALI-1.44]ONI72992.1 hypothetical protein ALI144C_44340 [Actinosynnema sp. ALI-1.44]